MASSRRKITNAEEARSLLAELDASGLDGPTFCRQEGLDGRSLHCWRLNLARGQARKQQSELEPLRVVELTWPGAPATRELASIGRYRVTVGDAVIEVDDAFDNDTFARLLAVVRAC